VLIAMFRDYPELLLAVALFFGASDGVIARFSMFSEIPPEFGSTQQKTG